MERTHLYNSTSFQICLTLPNQNFEWWKILIRFVKLFCSIWTFEYVFVSSFLCCYIANTLALSYPYSHQMKINVRSIYMRLFLSSQLSPGHKKQGKVINNPCKFFLPELISQSTGGLLHWSCSWFLALHCNLLWRRFLVLGEWNKWDFDNIHTKKSNLHDASHWVD